MLNETKAYEEYKKRTSMGIMADMDYKVPEYVSFYLLLAAVILGSTLLLLLLLPRI